MKLIWDVLNLNSSQDLRGRVSQLIHFINIYQARTGARGAAVDHTDKISALMELIVGKIRSWKDTYGQGLYAQDSGLRALGCELDGGPFRARATVEAVSVGEPGRGEVEHQCLEVGGVIRGAGGQKPVTGRGCPRSVTCCIHSFIQIGA